MNKDHSIHFLAGRYIAELFTQKLPQNLLFHNFHHTANVVRGVREISKNLKLEKEEKEILLLAAWFHDSGHIKTYHGHEQASQEIATAFLEPKHYPKKKLEKVLDCIAATQMPQQPKNQLQKVICDADLYHLSLLEYIHLQFMLREEWSRALNKDYSDVDWMTENLAFIKAHRYHTSYGQEVLRKRKLVNVKKCEELMEELG